MTIDNIIKKIESETAEEVNKILQQANKEARELDAEETNNLNHELNKLKEEGNKRITIMRNIHLSEARRIARRIILSAKEELIDECFSQAKEQLKSMTGEEYKNVIVQLINESLPLIGESGSVALTREEDKTILSSFPKLTVKPNLTPGLGGVILESADGKVVVDNTFDAILERRKENIRTEVANILFSDE